MSTVDPR